MASRNFRDLIAWQRAMDLVELTYRLTRQFPREELFSLTNQLRRAAISISSNIAEGQGRGGGVEFARFLKIAYGSLRELETQFEIARRLHYLDGAQLCEAIEAASEVGRLLNGLLKSSRP